MKAKCYVCKERIDHHNRCRKRACKAQLEQVTFDKLILKVLREYFESGSQFTHVDY